MWSKRRPLHSLSTVRTNREHAKKRQPWKEQLPRNCPTGSIKYPEVRYSAGGRGGGLVDPVARHAMRSTPCPNQSALYPRQRTLSVAGTGSQMRYGTAWTTQTSLHSGPLVRKRLDSTQLLIQHNTRHKISSPTSTGLVVFSNVFSPPQRPRLGISTAPALFEQPSVDL